MPKLLSRIVCFFVIPCLLLDPAVAAVVNNTHTIRMGQRFEIQRQLFSEQALAPAAAPEGHSLSSAGPLIATQAGQEFRQTIEENPPYQSLEATTDQLRRDWLQNSHLGKVFYDVEVTESKKGDLNLRQGASALSSDTAPESVGPMDMSFIQHEPDPAARFFDFSRIHNLLVNRVETHREGRYELKKTVDRITRKAAAKLALFEKGAAPKAPVAVAPRIPSQSRATLTPARMMEQNQDLTRLLIDLSPDALGFLLRDWPPTRDAWRLADKSAEHRDWRQLLAAFTAGRQIVNQAQMISGTATRVISSFEDPHVPVHVVRELANAIEALRVWSPLFFQEMLLSNRAIVLDAPKGYTGVVYQSERTLMHLTPYLPYDPLTFQMMVLEEADHQIFFRRISDRNVAVDPSNRFPVWLRSYKYSEPSIYVYFMELHAGLLALEFLSYAAGEGIYASSEVLRAEVKYYWNRTQAILHSFGAISGEKRITAAGAAFLTWCQQEFREARWVLRPWLKSPKRHLWGRAA